MKNGWLILLLFVAGMVGCHAGDDTSGGESVPAVLRFRSDIRQYSGSFIPLPERTETGLFISPSGQSAASAQADCYNLKFTSGANGELLSQSPVGLTEHEDYTVYAYAPYQEKVEDPESILFAHGTDVLGCTVPAEIRDVSAPQYTGTLRFVHCSAQIRFVVKIADDSSLGELAATSVLKATGFLPQGRLNVSNGNLTAEGEASEATAVKVAAGRNGQEEEYSLESEPVCFFTLGDIPQTILLRVTHEGVTRNGSITQVFHPGESHLFTIYVSNSFELTMTATLTPWINEDETIEFD